MPTPVTRRRVLGSALGASVIAGAFLAASVAAANNPGGGPRSLQATPDGFNKYLVYLGETVAPEEPGLFMDDETVYYFQEEVMGRSEAEIDAHRDAAKQYYWDQFGLNFGVAEGPETEGADFTGFMQNPNANYRAYTISEDWVPSQGWMVRDGGWAAIITAEDGMVLGGEYGGEEGKWVPEGTMMVFGDYSIKVERPQSGAPPHADEVIEIHFRSPLPLIEDPDGVLSFVCDLYHEEWGAGKARGVSQGGVIRNILTFPPDLQE